MNDLHEQLASTYAPLQKKHGLPSLQELEKEFDIINWLLEKDMVPEHLLRLIRRQMVNWCYSWANYLHGYMVPNPNSAINMEEFNMFKEDEKAQMPKIIDHLMFHARSALHNEITRDEKDEAAFIKALWADLPHIKKELSPIIEKNIDGWRSAVSKQQKEKKATR